MKQGYGYAIPLFSRRYAPSWTIYTIADNLEVTACFERPKRSNIWIS